MAPRGGPPLAAALECGDAGCEAPNVGSAGVPGGGRDWPRGTPVMQSPKCDVADFGWLVR